jgi:hypothetical protein
VQFDKWLPESSPLRQGTQFRDKRFTVLENRNKDEIIIQDWHKEGMQPATSVQMYTMGRGLPK